MTTLILISLFLTFFTTPPLISVLPYLTVPWLGFAWLGSAPLATMLHPRGPLHISTSPYLQQTDALFQNQDILEWNGIT